MHSPDATIHFFHLATLTSFVAIVTWAIVCRYAASMVIAFTIFTFTIFFLTATVIIEQRKERIFRLNLNDVICLISMMSLALSR